MKNVKLVESVTKYRETDNFLIQSLKFALSIIFSANLDCVVSTQHDQHGFTPSLHTPVQLAGPFTISLMNDFRLFFPVD